MRHIYTSLDIGTDTIKIIVSELYHGKINLLASSSVKSKGIKKGIVADVDEARSSLMMAIEEVETKLGIKVKEVITTIPSYAADFELIRGTINIDHEDGIVNGDDIIKVLQQGIKVEEVNMEMVTIIPINFVLDDVETVKDPKGRQVKKLSSKAILVTVPSKNMYGVMKLLDKCGLEPVDISLGGICDMYALKNSELDNTIGAVINIGAETTTISLYNKCIIIKNKVLDFGGKIIDKDLAYIYKTSMVEAKKLKEKFAVGSVKYSNTTDIYDLIGDDGKVVKVTQREVSEVVVARLDEMLKTVKKELSVLAERPLDYILFTGGTSNIPYLEYLIEDIFGDIAKIGRINIVGVRNNKYSTGLGNIVYFVNKEKLKGELTSMIDSDDEDSLSSLKKNVLNVSNESVIGKVTQYFFGE